MRINKYLAQATGVSRRSADQLIASGSVTINGQAASLGSQVADGDKVLLNGKPTQLKPFQYVILHKPVGYVCSKRQQGDTPTVFSLLPGSLQHLQVAGRLDADSSGLILLTNDGTYALHMTHPTFHKAKRYTVKIDAALSKDDEIAITNGVQLDDGVSKLALSGDMVDWDITMHEGRNRQIRRTFEALGYKIVSLHRTALGPYTLDKLAPKEYSSVDKL